jgi:hypothetical protein
LYDFSGYNYAFLGQFASLRPEAILWRLRKLNEILDGRRGTMGQRVATGMLSSAQAELVENILKNVQIWVLVTSPDDKTSIQNELAKNPLNYKADVATTEDMFSEIRKSIPSGA